MLPIKTANIKNTAKAGDILNMGKLVDRAGFEPAYGNPGRFTVCCL
jgi:hypothetical protein